MATSVDFLFLCTLRCAGSDETRMFIPVVLQQPQIQFNFQSDVPVSDVTKFKTGNNE